MMKKQSSTQWASVKPYWSLYAVGLIGLYAYWGAILSGASTWASTPDEQHGFLVIPLAIFLLYRNRANMPESISGVDLRGFLLVAIAGAMRVYSVYYIRPWMDLWSLPVWIAGIVWLLGGLRMLRWAGPYIAFLFFMASLPGQLQTAAGGPLQVIAANGGGWLLQILGQPAITAGNTVLLGENALDVQQACAGLRMFQGMLATAAAWSLFMGYTWKRVAALLAIAPIIAVVVNVLRITATGLLFQYVDGEFAKSFAHDWAGLLMIPTGALIFFLIDNIVDKAAAYTRTRPDGILQVASAAIVGLILLLGVGYYVHRYQRNNATELLLQQARKLARSEDEKDQATALDYIQRYLSVVPNNAVATSEMADMVAAKGEDSWMRAARLYELAWRVDSSRLEDAVQSAAYLDRARAWRLLWDRTSEFLPLLNGDQRVDVLRMRTRAVSQISRSSIAGSDAKMFYDACDAAYAEDGEFFPHMWQASLLVRLDPNVAATDASVGEPTSADQNPQEIKTVQGIDEYPLDDATQSDEASWRSLLTEADSKALSMVDLCVAENPGEPEPLLYRIAILDSLNLVTATTEIEEAIQVEAAILAALQKALNRALASVNEQVQLPITSLDKADADLVRQANVAANIFMIAGKRAGKDGEVGLAQQYFEKSRTLQPSNYQVYVQMAKLVDPKSYDDLIKIYKEGLNRCGRFELALLLPLAEAYLGAGKDVEAEALLKPVESRLPSIGGADRGRIELMLASTRAAGLAQQNRLREAVDVLSNACKSQAVVANMGSFPSLYANTQFLLGALYRDLNQDAMAAAAFKEGGRFNADSPLWHLDAARAYELAGNIVDALDQYKRAAAAIGRQQPGIYLAIARALLSSQADLSAPQRELEEVRSFLQIGVDHGADVVLASVLLAESYVVAENWPAALQVLTNQIKETPKESRLYFSRALVHELNDNFSEALKDLKLYEAVGASPAEVLLLQVLLFDRNDRLPEAIDLVEKTESEFEETELKDVRTQLVIALLNRGNLDVGTQRLKDLAKQYPTDANIQRLSAGLFEDLRIWDELSQVEENLVAIEGEEKGTYWRAARAARLLRTADTQEELNEANLLIQELEQLLPDWPRTLSLRGEIAEQSGQWSQALSSYESAWAKGQRNTALAARLLNALNQTGQATRATEFINALDDLVPRSTSLFDRAMPQLVGRNKSEYVLELARRWAAEEPTAENLIRLGQTLMTVAASKNGEAGDAMESEKTLAEAEEVLERALVLEPQELSAWIAIFQLESKSRGNRSIALQRLDDLSKTLEVDPIQRDFVLAQLFASIGEGARAGQLFDRCLERAELESGRIPDAAGLKAAEFFAGSRPEHAMDICRKVAVDQSLAAQAATRLMITLLEEQATVAALSEAITLHQSNGEISTDSQTSVKRLHAKLLTERIEIAARNDNSAEPEGMVDDDAVSLSQPPEAREDSSSSLAGQVAQQPSVMDRLDSVSQITSSEFNDDLRLAEELLQSITPRSAEDAALLARVYRFQDRRLDALNAHREAFRLELPDADRLVYFLDFWNQAFASSGQYAPIADNYLEELARLPGQSGRWLVLMLAQAQIQRAALANAEEEGNSKPTTASKPILSDAEILDLYRQKFALSAASGTYELGVFGCFSGLAVAGRDDLVAPALAGFNDAVNLRESEGLYTAVASAAIQSVDDAPKISLGLATWLRQKIPIDGPAPAGIFQMVADAQLLGGEARKAVDYYRAAIAKNPESTNAANSLVIAMAESEGLQREAFELIDQLIAKEPDNNDLLDTKLIVAILGENWEIADALSEKLAEEFTAAVLLHRSYVAAQRDNLDLAQQLFEMARDAGIESRLQTQSDKHMFGFLKENFVNSDYVSETKHQIESDRDKSSTMEWAVGAR